MFPLVERGQLLSWYPCTSLVGHPKSFASLVVSTLSFHKTFPRRRQIFRKASSVASVFFESVFSFLQSVQRVRVCKCLHRMTLGVLSLFITAFARHALQNYSVFPDRLGVVRRKSSPVFER